MLKFQVEASDVLNALKAHVATLGVPTEGKVVLARLVYTKGVVTSAEVALAAEGEDTSSFEPVAKEPVKRGPRKAKVAAAE